VSCKLAFRSCVSWSRSQFVRSVYSRHL